MELVTGRTGNPHITSQQDRQKHQGVFGDGAVILGTGNMLEPQVQSSNKILIKDGALMFQGALFSVKVGTTDEITINNGNQGMQRKDLVVARYTYDSSQNIESAEWVVIQGTPAASNPVAPTGTSGDIQAGDATVDCPFMIVNLNGINVTGVDVIEVMPDIPTLNADLAELSAKTAGYAYSTAETVIGKWIGGRNLYRKVFNIGNLRANKNQTYVAHRINNFDRAIHLYGSARNQSLESRFTLGLPLPAAGNATMEMSLHANDTNVYIYHNAEATVSNYSAVVVMEYIKTVD